MIGANENKNQKDHKEIFEKGRDPIFHSACFSHYAASFFSRKRPLIRITSVIPIMICTTPTAFAFP